MTTSTLGLITGLLLGVAAAAGGVFGLIVTVVLGAVGFLIGAHRDGELDLSAVFRGRDRG